MGLHFFWGNFLAGKLNDLNLYRVIFKPCVISNVRDLIKFGTSSCSAVSTVHVTMPRVKFDRFQSDHAAGHVPVRSAQRFHVLSALGMRRSTTGTTLFPIGFHVLSYSVYHLCIISVSSVYQRWYTSARVSSCIMLYHRVSSVDTCIMYVSFVYHLWKFRREMIHTWYIHDTCMIRMIHVSSSILLELWYEMIREGGVSPGT